jgi:hypothetical protein
MIIPFDINTIWKEDKEEDKILKSIASHFNNQYQTDYVFVNNIITSKNRKYKDVRVLFTRKMQSVSWTLNYPYWAVKYPSLLDTEKKREKFDCTYVDPTAGRSLLALVQIMKPIRITNANSVIVLKHLLKSESVLDSLSAPPNFQQEMRQSFIKTSTAKKLNIKEKDFNNGTFLSE